MIGKRKKIIIIGGGAAAFFTAANLHGDQADILLLEQAGKVLQKVKIAGGGRCNITHACFDPKELVRYYPRGHKELLSVFTKFQPGDTMAWFENRDLPLKIEADNRIFPVTDSSQSVMDLLISSAEANGTVIKTKEGVRQIKRKNDRWEVTTKHRSYPADHVVFCTGSSPKAYKILQSLNLEMVDLVPSLFTFNIQHHILDGFMGTSFSQASVKIPQLKTEESGPLLITHWGLSGPAVLKLSAYCARDLAMLNYQFDITVNFLGYGQETARAEFENFKEGHPKKTIGQAKIFPLTHRFWQHLLSYHHIPPEKQLAQINKKELHQLIGTLCQCNLTVNGKSTFKEEFVTAGGVKLNQIDFKTMRAKSLKNFYLAGEVLDIDAVTGGFNFQACWSAGYLIARALNEA